MGSFNSLSDDLGTLLGLWAYRLWRSSSQSQNGPLKMLSKCSRLFGERSLSLPAPLLPNLHHVASCGQLSEGRYYSNQSGVPDTPQPGGKDNGEIYPISPEAKQYLTEYCSFAGLRPQAWEVPSKILCYLGSQMDLCSSSFEVHWFGKSKVLMVLVFVQSIIFPLYLPRLNSPYLVPWHFCQNWPWYAVYSFQMKRSSVWSLLWPLWPLEFTTFCIAWSRSLM